MPPTSCDIRTQSKEKRDENGAHLYTKHVSSSYTYRHDTLVLTYVSVYHIYIYIYITLIQQACQFILHI